MCPAEHKNITLGGIKVHYVQAGHGPLVLLLHGLGASWVTWHLNIGALAEAGFTAVALDLPGHGDSDKPSNWSYHPADQVKLVHEFSLALGADRVSVVGNSAGGLIAALFALEYPEEVERLVLVASGGLGKRAYWFLRMLSQPVLGDLLYQQWLHRKLGIPKRIFYHPPRSLDQVLPELRRVNALPGSRRAVLRSIRANVKYFELKEQRRVVDRLKDFPSPLMTVWGENDIVVSVSHAEMFRRDLPNSPIYTIPECGHWPHMEHADHFNSLLTAFLKDAPVDCSGRAGG